ncbi:MAG TPA: hypothetical protein VMM84_06880 [Pyrinomonadaceae bacterium]|nr:hypothetical protein [Pyrinomonadaceae bacterium]
MKFLKSFFLTLKGWLSKRQIPHSPVVAVSDNEQLARYIFSKSHFSRQSNRVKAEAYMPNRGQVSVFRIDGLTESAIWGIGDYIALKRERTLYGRGDTTANQVRNAGLDISSDEPPPRHANLIGWPENDKGRHKLIALQIAAVATLVLKE